MAIFHCNVKLHSRLHDSSNHAVRSAAYRAGTVLTDEQSGNTYNYSRKNEVSFSEIILPDNAPDFLSDRSKLWNIVEATEKRVDAQLFREVEVALPIEMTREQHKKLIRKYIKRNFTCKGMVADYSIHENEGNPHCHIMLTLRSLNDMGFGNKNRDWNDKRLINIWRESWADIVNECLTEIGTDERIDHRSYEKQGLNIEPTVHEGRISINKSNTRTIEKRRNRNSRIRAANHTRTSLAAAERELELIQTELDSIEDIKPAITNARIRNSIRPLHTTPAQAQPEVKKAISNAPAPNDLLIRARQALTPLRPIYDSALALPHGCMDVRLPNGKIIYPANVEALEQAITAWDVPDKEAKSIRKAFWSSCTFDYYNNHLNCIIKNSQGSHSLDDYPIAVLTRLKLAGMSPEELIKFTAEESNSKHNVLCTIEIKGQQVGIESLKQLDSLVYYERQHIKDRAYKAFYSSIPLTEYYKMFSSKLKQYSLVLANTDPIELFASWKEGITVNEAAKSIRQNTPYAGVYKLAPMPEAFVALFEGRPKISHHKDLVEVARKHNLLNGDLTIILSEWWPKIEPDDYYEEARIIARQRNLIMPFDSLSKDKVLQGLTERYLPNDWLEVIFGDTDDTPPPNNANRFTRPMQPSHTSSPTPYRNTNNSGWGIK